MRTGTNQALKLNDDSDADDAVGTQECANKARAVRLALLGAKPGELLPKEVACCNMATD